MELGLYTFAETTPDASRAGRRPLPRVCASWSKRRSSPSGSGCDVFGVGEHHRPDYIVSSPAVVLGAIASATSRIRLTSAVTVLSSDDPVRVFQDFATLDLLSSGRAEIMAGRGSFIESFPLFGFNLDDYDALFAEKLDLLLRLREEGPVTWSGIIALRSPASDVYPRPVQQPLPVWIAVGGTPCPSARQARSASRWHSRSSAARRSGSRHSSRSGAKRHEKRATNPARLGPEHQRAWEHRLDDSRQAGGRVLSPVHERRSAGSAASVVGRRTTRAAVRRIVWSARRAARRRPEDRREKILFQYDIFGNQALSRIYLLPACRTARRCARSSCSARRSRRSCAPGSPNARAKSYGSRHPQSA